MPPTTPPPSSSLVRAAAREQQQLARHRDQLMTARERLHEELARIEAGLREVSQRTRLLDQLAPAAEDQATAEPAVKADEGRPGEFDGMTLLKGTALRETAVRLAVCHPAGVEAMHYRDWHQLLREAGFDAAGKDPQAVLLTQLSRSPAVRRSTQPGVYEIDRDASNRLRSRVRRLHQQLRELASSTDEDLQAVRSRRTELLTDIDRTERALDEADRVLDGAASEVPAIAV